MWKGEMGELREGTVCVCVCVCVRTPYFSLNVMTVLMGDCTHVCVPFHVCVC